MYPHLCTVKRTEMEAITKMLSPGKMFLVFMVPFPVFPLV